MDTAGGVPSEGACFYLIPHTHWDREWYLPLEHFRSRLVRLLDGLIDLLERDPQYHSFHLDGQTIVLEDYEEIRGRSTGLRRLIAAGRIRIGPWYVLPDEFLVSGEALVRNLERGLELCREFGAARPRLGYLPDMFGHIAQMPQVLAGFGMTWATAWRGVPATVIGQQFAWRSPDGTELPAAYLPLGYGLASALPRDPALLAERLDSLLREVPPIGPERAVLLLNGSDHVPPQPFAAQVLDAACGLRPGWTWRFATWDDWMDALRASGDPEIVHTGEMRSSERTLILPSVASARLYLKKMDFELSRALERYAEPAAALCRALGGPDLSGDIDYAWKLLLQNHPHDSICGCSVDAVHDEMETRYRKAQQTASRALGLTLETVLAKAPGPSLAVMNPAGELRPAVLSAVVDGRVKPGQEIVTPEGKSFPLQVVEPISPEQTLMDWKMDREVALMVMRDLIVPEQYGLFVQAAEVKVKDGSLEVRLDAGSTPSGLDLEPARDQAERILSDPAVTRARARIKQLPRQRVACVLDRLPGPAIWFCGTRKSKSAQEPAATIGPDFMENDLVKVLFEPGGTCLVTDKRTGLGYRCLRFLDVGDRGDSYNFDPAPDAPVLCEMDKVSLKSVAGGPAAAVMEVRHRLRVPESLHAGRRARSRKRKALDLATTVTVYRGSARVDFRTRFVNNVRDHRLQTAVRAPFEAHELTVESAFALVKRPIVDQSPPAAGRREGLSYRLLGDEGVYTASPHKTVAMIGRDGRGVAVMNRGMAEVEVRRLDGATRVALTMVRSVGWLSRGDLAMRRGDAGPMMEAPGAQCLRPFEWEYAVMPFGPDHDPAQVLAQAHAFAYPPVAFPAAGGAGPEGGEVQWAALDNPKVYISAFRARPGGEAEIRLANGADTPQRFRLTWGRWWSGARITDLKGGPAELAGARLSDRELEAELRPAGIVTVRLTETIGRT